MASASASSTAALSLPSSTTKPSPPRQCPAAILSPSPPSQCVTLPTTLFPPPFQSSQRTTSFCRSKINARCSVVAQSTGEAVAPVTGESVASVTGEAAVAETASTELPEIVKTVQSAWDKVDDKYAVTSIGVAGVIALYGIAGMISAIDRLPFVPGVLELIGIGYTGWFAYKNLIFQPDREQLIKKIRDIYSDIVGSS